MDNDHVTVPETESPQYTWIAGIAGGLIGGIGMGIILHAGANMMPFIGALYGWPTVVGGWIGHLINSVIIGLVFTFIVSRPLVRQQTMTISGSVVVGVLYAAAVGLVTTGVMLPISMNVLGVQSLPEALVPLPGYIGGLLVVLSVAVAHLVYGLLLGATYGILHAVPETTNGK